MDENLISMLLANETTKAQFFEEVSGVVVFDKIAFGWVVNNKEFLPDSYTRFKNKIGLVDENGEALVNTGKVELVFSYKDCVLEGGQTKDNQERKSSLMKHWFLMKLIDCYIQKFFAIQFYTLLREKKGGLLFRGKSDY
jgi:adenine specific DNA methylase mod